MTVHASTLSAYEFCPRSVYLKEVLELKPEVTGEMARGLVGHAVRKEMSLRQAQVVKDIKEPEELEQRLARELDRIAVDAGFIHREKLEDLDYRRILQEIRPEIEREAKVLAERLAGMIEELGFEESLRLLTPWKVEYSLRSEELGLTGRVDKVMLEGFHVPVEIKTGAVGEGVWAGDRLQVCAYALLLEEKFSEHVPHGVVEYTRVGERRPVLASEALRRRVLSARDEVEGILSGKVPEICPHGSGKKCESCGLKEECYKI